MSDATSGALRVEPLEAELRHQRQHLVVRAVDELAAELGGEAVAEQVGGGEHAAAGPIGAFEDRARAGPACCSL